MNNIPIMLSPINIPIIKIKTFNDAFNFCTFNSFLVGTHPTKKLIIKPIDLSNIDCFVLIFHIRVIQFGSFKQEKR